MAQAMAVATVKETTGDALDWREQFKKRPVAWSLGAAGGGFLLGYAIAAMATSESSEHRAGSDYAPSESQEYAAGPILGQAAHSGFDPRNTSQESNEQRKDSESASGLLERFQQTEVYDQLRREAASVGKRLVGELSQTAQEVVLPAAISWLRKWLAGLASEAKNADHPPATAGGTDFITQRAFD